LITSKLILFYYKKVGLHVNPLFG